MSDENKTLNRGLDALLGQNNIKQRSVKEVDLLKIKPGRFQPRSNFDNEKFRYNSATIYLSDINHPKKSLQKKRYLKKKEKIQ